MASIHGLHRRWVAAASVVASVGLVVPAVGGPPQAVGSALPPATPQGINQDVKYIWPSALSVEPFVFPGDTFAASLATIGEEGYERFVRKDLPKELEANQQFAEEFDKGDSGRLNSAFRRWQIKVWSLKTATPVPEIDWDGKDINKVKGVKYEYPEFYKSAAHNEYSQRLTQSFGDYFKRLKQRNQQGGKLKIFSWMEVFHHGGWLSPHVHTGAPACGVLCLKCGTGVDGQSLVFADPRGKTAPFGQTYEHKLQQGELLIFPSWLEHYVSPLRGNGTNVLLGFMAWFPGGAPDFDWEDDVLGDYTYEKTLSMTTSAGAGQAHALGDGKEVIVRNGEEACEGRSLTQQACLAVGCCQYNEGQCHSAIGANPCASASGPPDQRLAKEEL